jgi:predicted nucleic acid-binding protein
VTTLIDSGPLVAAANRKDFDHERCLRLFRDLPGPLLLPDTVLILLPDTVLIEACWVIGDRIGPKSHAVFLEAVAAELERDRYQLIALTPPDLARMAELVTQYTDLRLDPTDASVMAIAERLNVKQVATLDRRDFSVVRPRHAEVFSIVP